MKPKRKWSEEDEKKWKENAAVVIRYWDTLDGSVNTDVHYPKTKEGLEKLKKDVDAFAKWANEC